MKHQFSTIALFLSSICLNSGIAADTESLLDRVLNQVKELETAGELPVTQCHQIQEVPVNSDIAFIHSSSSDLNYVISEASDIIKSTKLLEVDQALLNELVMLFVRNRINASAAEKMLQSINDGKSKIENRAVKDILKKALDQYSGVQKGVEKFIDVASCKYLIVNDPKELLDEGLKLTGKDGDVKVTPEMIEEYKKSFEKPSVTAKCYKNLLADHFYK